MRPALPFAIALALSAAGAASAQSTQPMPSMQPMKPLGPQSFTPYKPPTYLNPETHSSAADPYPHMRHTPGLGPAPKAATPQDPYPNLHPRRKDPFAGG